MFEDTQAIPSLLQVLEDPDRNVRIAAIKSLGTMKGDAQVVKAFIQLLQDSDPAVRKTTSDTLGDLGTPVVDPLVQALQDNNSKVRWGAAEALDKQKWTPNKRQSYYGTY